MKPIQNRTAGVLTDQIAAALAGRIIKLQTHLSGRMNRWFNAFSVRQKKGILVAFGLLTSITLIAGLFCSIYTVAPLSQHYTSAHIGMASDSPGPPFCKRQLTNSLTIKK